MNNDKFELISHHLCPFLHKSVILLEKKGLKQNIDFKVTRLPIYNLPEWLFELSPKVSMPLLKLSDNRILSRSVTINGYFNETIEPSFLPLDSFERAQHRGLIFTCGELLDFMRNVYTAKDESVMNINIDKIFAGLQDIKKDLRTLIDKTGTHETQMVECSFMAFFTVLLNFDMLKNDKRWQNMTELKAYADKLIADPIVINSKSPDYNKEFDNFFNHFGSVFKLKNNDISLE